MRDTYFENKRDLKCILFQVSIKYVYIHQYMYIVIQYGHELRIALHYIHRYTYIHCNVSVSASALQSDLDRDLFGEQDEHL